MPRYLSRYSLTFDIVKFEMLWVVMEPMTGMGNSIKSWHVVFLQCAGKTSYSIYRYQLVVSAMGKKCRYRVLGYQGIRRNRFKIFFVFPALDHLE